MDFTSMVDVLGSSCQLDEAQVFIDKIPFEIDASALGALLEAYHIHVNMDLGKCMVERLIEIEPQNAST